MAASLAAAIINSKHNSNEETARILCRLSTQLTASGGYANYVLADTANRIAISSLVELLVKNKITPEKALMLARVSAKFPTTEMWEDLFEEELHVNKNSLNLKNIDKVFLLQTICQISGITNMDDLYYQLGNRSISTTSLIARRNIGALAHRMAETETYSIAHVPALVFFLQNGGDINQIDLDDVSEIQKIFSKTTDQYSSPLLNLSHINELHLKQISADALLRNESKRILLGYE